MRSGPHSCQLQAYSHLGGRAIARGADSNSRRKRRPVCREVGPRTLPSRRLNVDALAILRRRRRRICVRRIGPAAWLTTTWFIQRFAAEYQKAKTAATYIAATTEKQGQSAPLIASTARGCAFSVLRTCQKLCFVGTFAANLDATCFRAMAPAGYSGIVCACGWPLRREFLLRAYCVHRTDRHEPVSVRRKQQDESRPKARTENTISRTLSHHSTYGRRFEGVPDSLV